MYAHTYIKITPLRLHLWPTDYVKKYHELGNAMFEHCIIPTVADFAKAFEDNDDDNIKHINYIKLANFVLFSAFDHFTFNEAVS